MECRCARAMIMDYIDDKLESEEVIPFIEHVRSCDDCMEELEIYYTLLSGIRELDQGGAMIRDFKQALSDDLEERCKQREREEKITDYIWYITGAMFFLFAVLVLLAEVHFL